MNISLAECNDEKSFLSRRKRTHPHEVVCIKLSLDSNLDISHNKNHITPVEGDEVLLEFSLGELDGEFSEMFCVIRKDSDLLIMRTENNKCMVPRRMIKHGCMFVKVVLVSDLSGDDLADSKSDDDIRPKVTTNWSEGILIGSWYDRRPEQI